MFIFGIFQPNVFFLLNSFNKCRRIVVMLRNATGAHAAQASTEFNFAQTNTTPPRALCWYRA
jgi:hypothetical protein